MSWKHEAVLKRRDIFEVDPHQVRVVDGWNPRTDFSGHDELEASIIENGVIEPITVKVVNEKIELVDGERRLRATLSAISHGREIVSIPASLARKGINDIESLFLALIKNDGKPLAPSEEAEAFRRLTAWGMTQADIAKRIGRSQPYVCDRLALIDAAPEVKQAVDKKTITKKTAKRIIKQSAGSVDKQRKGLQYSKDHPEDGNGFKTMPRKAMEKIIAEYRAVDDKALNDAAREFNRGVIAGLSMAFFNSPDIKKEWML